jgi:heme exporter protein A
MSLASSSLGAVRGERVLFSGIGLTLREGEALWVKGGNGSGKTTLLRLLCGLGVPHEGEVLWRGQPVRRLRESFHRHLLYVGHASGVKDDLLAWENLVAAAALAGQRCTRAMACDALTRIGLGDQAALAAAVLSQGQRRRVALARLYLGSLPQLLVLDEPFSALDQRAIAILCARLDAHLAAGGMVVYTTHQPVALTASRLEQLDLSMACAC